MPKIVKGIKETPKKETIKCYCRKCQKTKSSEEFFNATDTSLDSNGYMSICSKCCNDRYNYYFSLYNNVERALHYTCQDFNVMFNRMALEQTQTHVEKLLSRGRKADAVFGIYKSKLMSTGGKNAELTSFRYKDGETFYNNSTLKNENEITNTETINPETKKDMIMFFGSNFSDTEYLYLADKFNEYINTYECETPAMSELLKQAAFESLEIYNRRQKREDASKNLKNLQDILGAANIKPNQESGANATDQATFGTLIKKWESEEPIPEPDEEWRDVDNIGKYIRIWFLGHLCKMMGINNDYSKEYESEMAKLSVNIPDNIEQDEDLEDGDI